MVRAGEGYRFHVTGLTHDERGYPSMNVETQDRSVTRLLEKLEPLAGERALSETADLEDAEVVVVSYGITSRVAQRAIEMARAARRARRQVPHHLGLAVPRAAHRRAGPRVKALVVPELNLGQMVREVERAVAGQCKVTLVPHAGGTRAQSRSDSEGHPGGGPMNEQTLEIPCDIPADAAKPGRAVSAHGPHAAHLVSGLRHRHHRQLLHPRAARIQRQSRQSGHRHRASAAPAAWPAMRNLDSFHTTHGRAIPFATGLKLANPELQVVVYSGDGDLFAIGGNHFIHAARRNMDLKVICVNNLTYAMTGGQTAPTTPGKVISATSPYGVFEPAFNLVRSGRSRRRILRGALDHLPRQAAYPLHGRGAAQERILLHRSDFALPHALSAPQQDGRRPGHHEVLQAGQQNPPRRADQRSAI